MTEAAPAHLNLEGIRTQGKQGVAAALSVIEQSSTEPAVVALLDGAYSHPIGTVIGVTGPPGAGKSTLIDALIHKFRHDGQTVAVLAVDPSSQRTGGALLGDRVRMRTDPADDGVFIRSIAARKRLGGLASGIFPAAVLLRALYNTVIVESVGVGQSETEIAAVADTVVLCIQPGSGDSLQFMKAGILEIPHIAVVTKADIGAMATRALADLRGALSLGQDVAYGFDPVCLTVSSTTGVGLDALAHAIQAHRTWLANGDNSILRRTQQAKAWMHAEVCAGFGAQGLAISRAAVGEADVAYRPFKTTTDLIKRLRVSLAANPLL